MPFGDRSIDILLVTNPDADHFAGFIELLEEYYVGVVIELGTISNTKTYQDFENLLEEKNIPRILARKGMQVTLDTEREILFDVLFPDRDVSSWSRNDGSIVGVLSWGSSDILFMGDATIKTERMFKHLPDVEIIKIGHHGSKTSTSEQLLRISKPEYAVISVGEGNTYGHPHDEIIRRLESIEVLRTDILGTVEFSVVPTGVFRE